MKTSDFDYELPDELIAAHPLPDRAASRMMVVDRAAGTIRHAMFRDFPSLLCDGDICIFNNSRVVPARFFSEDGKIEILRIAEPEPLVWHCLVKPGKKMRPGAVVSVAGATGTVEAVVEEGMRRIRWNMEIDLERHGQLALPPYMNRAQEEEDRERYQTVYARAAGSVAAPTAGLHFTDEILAAIPHAFVTLHVGIGTFRPVKAEAITDHQMHAEQFFVPDETVAAMAGARRVVAIGTTSARVLESATEPGAHPQAGPGVTSIYIHPPYTFKCVGALLTNFHLPKSTLLMLVSALAGRELILEAYREAVKERYRFFSYGDCMFIT
ncbi:MAG: tRNA preQ1(34) S-adenosylmethionine ribosyltransferase-isomerase QueA [Verrucomicrobiales bacterium]